MATYYFDSSIFSQFFNNDDPAVLGWANNVLDKLVSKGLIPSYIERYNDINGDEDYNEFWLSICKFFAYYVVYARAYQTFYQNEGLLREYLEERGLVTSPNDTLPELYYLMSHYNNEIFHRGTIHIVDMEDDGYDVFGELLRLIQYKPDDEFIFNVAKTEHAGWNLNNCSPLYRSLTNSDNVNKWYEKTSEPSDITKYPATGTVTIVTDGTINKKVLNIVSGGIHGNFSNGAIKVSEFLDYELTFYIKKTDGNNLSVGIDAFDSAGTPIALQSVFNGTGGNDYLINANLQRSDKYVCLSFFLYNKLKPYNAADQLNLKMVDGVSYVVPKILINGSSAKIYNVRFVPMLTPYSKGFLQINNWIDCWAKNNNNKITPFEIRKFIGKYLIPYNSEFELIDIEKAGDYSHTGNDIVPNFIYATTGNSTDETPTIWGYNVDTNVLNSILEIGNLSGVTNGVYQLAVTKEGVFYIIAQQDKKIRRINLKTGAITEVYTLSGAVGFGATFDFNGNLYLINNNSVLKVSGIDPNNDSSVKTELSIDLMDDIIFGGGDIVFYKGDALIVGDDVDGNSKIWKINFTDVNRNSVNTPELIDLGYIKKDNVIISNAIKGITSIRGVLYGFDLGGRIYLFSINDSLVQVDAFQQQNSNKTFHDAAGYNDPFQS